MLLSDDLLMLQFLSFLRNQKRERNQPLRNQKKEERKLVLEMAGGKPTHPAQ